jgi:hypothetical protein
MEKHGGIKSTGENSYSSTRVLWQSYQKSHLAANQEELAIYNSCNSSSNSNDDDDDDNNNNNNVTTEVSAERSKNE